MYPLSLIFFLFGCRTGTEALLEEIVGGFDVSLFQAALPPGNMAGTHRQKLGQPHQGYRTKLNKLLRLRLNTGGCFSLE
jgi:hypothetical protein